MAAIVAMVVPRFVGVLVIAGLLLPVLILLTTLLVAVVVVVVIVVVKLPLPP